MGTTDKDGRITQWTTDSFDSNYSTGNYQITFDIEAYHQGKGFFPLVCIPFRVDNMDQHYHVPLLLSPFSYSTYRGS
jgi:5-hydroxyisourate hydrolase